MIIFIIIILFATSIAIYRKQIMKFIKEKNIAYKYKKNHDDIFNVRNFNDWVKDFGDELTEELVCGYIKSVYKLDCISLLKIEPKLKDKVYIFYKDIKRANG